MLDRLPLTDDARVVRVELAGAPVGKGRPRFNPRGGRPYTPPKTESYERRLAWAARDAMGNRLPFDGPVAVRVEAFFPIAASWPKRRKAAALAGAIRPASKPDADNVLKAVDAFNAIVWRDDAQIVEASISKQYSDRPRLVVTVAKVG